MTRSEISNILAKDVIEFKKQNAAKYNQYIRQSRSPIAARNPKKQTMKIEGK